MKKAWTTKALMSRASTRATTTSTGSSRQKACFFCGFSRFSRFSRGCCSPGTLPSAAFCSPLITGTSLAPPGTRSDHEAARSCHGWVGSAAMRLPQQAARVRQVVAPDWLIDIVRPRPAPVPWALMVRAALAICVPLAAGLAAHEVDLGLLPAIGGLIAVSVDQGGPYWARAKRVGSATVFGGAVGLTIGTVIHGRGWIAVAVLVVIAGLSVVISELGSTGSVTALQLLTYAAFGF